MRHPAPRPSALRPLWPSALLAGVLWLAAATSSAAPAPVASPQAYYATPEAAAQALVDSVKGQNRQAVTQILGDPTLTQPDSPEVGQRERQEFLEKYQEMHRLVRRTDGSVVLQVGAENWPFPVPLVAREGGWRFDPDAGLHEVMFRRIGENEITAIEMCHALVDANRQGGRQPAAAGTDTDEEGRLLATVLETATPGKPPVRFHGYEFRVLPGAGQHFTAVAYPAVYRSSGVMTFVVNDDDVVYEKDLGRRSLRAARHIRAFHPDRTWRQAESEGGAPH